MRLSLLTSGSCCVTWFWYFQPSYGHTETLTTLQHGKILTGDDPNPKPCHAVQCIHVGAVGVLGAGGGGGNGSQLYHEAHPRFPTPSFG